MHINFKCRFVLKFGPPQICAVMVGLSRLTRGCGLMQLCISIKPTCEPGQNSPGNCSEENRFHGEGTRAGCAGLLRSWVLPISGVVDRRSMDGQPTVPVMMGPALKFFDGFGQIQDHYP